MLKKIPFLCSFIFVSAVLTAQQDSVRIEKAALLFYDSTEIAPVVTQIPYYDAREKVLSLNYRNISQLNLTNYSLEFKISHVQSSTSSPGNGLLHRKKVSQDSISPQQVKEFNLSVPNYTLCYLGMYKTDFIISNGAGTILDSASFIFHVTDTIYAKSNLLLSSVGTGPSLYQDTVMNQPGGTFSGDRFGTLMELNGSYSCGFPCATVVSVSFFITSDTSNIGTETVPKIWSVAVDSVTNRIIVGPEVASSFVPFVVNNSSLGRRVSLPLDYGVNITGGFNSGKYIVGFESTLLNPNGKSLLVGRDSVGEKLQPLRTSFVYFGQDTNWYAINHLPLIGLNFELPAIGGTGLPTAGCNTLSINGSNVQFEQLKIYPNPSNGTFTIDHAGSIQTSEVFNVNGQKVQIELVNNQFDLSEQPKGIYLLRVLLENGAFVSKS